MLERVSEREAVTNHTESKMHDLFTTVLSKRDLSRAGELFSVADVEIVNDLSEVVSRMYTKLQYCDYWNMKRLKIH